MVSFPRPLPLVFLSIAAVAACQVPDEQESQTEVTSQKLSTQTYPVRVRDNVTRYVRMQCDELCSIRTGVCAPYCQGSFLREIVLLENSGATTAYPATASGPYKGCGVSAIANVANYITGAFHTTESVHRWAGHKNWGFVWPLSYLNKDQGMTVDSVNDYLKIGLGDYRHRYFTTKVHNASLPAALPDIINSLKAGYPVVMLVNGGYHYQVITGYRAPDTFFMTDYTSQPLKERRFHELEFDNLGRLPSALFGFQGYHPGTYIKVTGYQLAPGGTPGAGGGGGPGTTCGDITDPPQCPAGQVLNDFCECACPANDATACSNQGGEYNHATCSCGPSQGI